MWAQIVSVLVTDAREAEGRPPEPTAVVVDSQPVKTTEAGRLQKLYANRGGVDSLLLGERSG